MKQWSDILKNVSMLTQFGLSLMMPLLMCLGLCWFLCMRTGIGGWIFIPGFFFGLGGSGTVAYKFYLGTVAKTEKEQKRKGTKAAFNRHD